MLEKSDFRCELIFWGIKEDIGQWVGTVSGQIVSAKYHHHRVLIYRDMEKGLLIGDVQIFSDSDYMLVKWQKS